MKSRLRSAIFSDVHLGHRTTPTEHIIQQLKLALPTNEETSNLDIIWISGDLFDRFLPLNHPDLPLIHEYIAWLLRLCKRHDIVLRVLEGTPSHDNKQAWLVEAINADVEIGADAKHVESLSIEYIERFGIHVLYIPDEWSSDNDDTWMQVQRLLSEHGLEQVDFTIMHGQFAYQLPPNLNVPVHIPERYAEITRYHVYCGHVHTPSTHLNIHVPGSFDRLKHAEEHPKGHLRTVVEPDGTSYVTFVENEAAWTYLSVDCTGLDAEAALLKLDAQVNELRAGSYVRVVAGQDDPAAACLDVAKRRWPMYNWTSKVEMTHKKGQPTLIDMRAAYKTVPITDRTVADLVRTWLTENAVDGVLLERCMERLKEVT